MKGDVQYQIQPVKARDVLDYPSSCFTQREYSLYIYRPTCNHMILVPIYDSRHRPLFFSPDGAMLHNVSSLKHYPGFPGPDTVVIATYSACCDVQASGRHHVSFNIMSLFVICDP